MLTGDRLLERSQFPSTTVGLYAIHDDDDDDDHILTLLDSKVCNLEIRDKTGLHQERINLLFM